MYSILLLNDCNDDDVGRSCTFHTSSFAPKFFSVFSHWIALHCVACSIIQPSYSTPLLVAFSKRYSSFAPPYPTALHNSAMIRLISATSSSILPSNLLNHLISPSLPYSQLTIKSSNIFALIFHRGVQRLQEARYQPTVDAQTCTHTHTEKENRNRFKEQNWMKTIKMLKMLKTDGWNNGWNNGFKTARSIANIWSRKTRLETQRETSKSVSALEYDMAGDYGDMIYYDGAG